MLAGLFLVSCASKNSDQRAGATVGEADESGAAQEQEATTTSAAGNQQEQNGNVYAGVNLKKPARELTYAEIDERLNILEKMINQLAKSSMSSSTFNSNKKQIEDLLDLLDDADLSDNQEDRYDDLKDKFEDIVD